MSMRSPSGFIRPGFDPLKNPDAPTGVSASGGDESASVSFTPPSNVGGSAVSAYYAVSNPGGITASGASSPVSVTGLTNGTAYTFAVWALNTYGPGPFSAASGSVSPEQLQRGIFVGGYPGPTNVIQYINIASTGNALDFGDLLAGNANGAGVGSSTRSVFAGNGDTVDNVIQFVTITSTGNATDFGDLLAGNSSMCGVSSDTRGVFIGGFQAGVGLVNVIQYITIASTGNATDFGDASTVGRYGSVGITGSNTRGLWANLDDNTTRTNTIAYVTIATTGNAADFGDTTSARNQLAGVGSSTRAVFCGGTTGTATNVMDYVTIASTGNATDFGDLSIACRLGAGASSSTRGVIAVGQDASNNPTNIMDYITIASAGNAIDFGDLLSNLNQMAGISNCHGGIA